MRGWLAELAWNCWFAREGSASKLTVSSDDDQPWMGEKSIQIGTVTLVPLPGWHRNIAVCMSVVLPPFYLYGYPLPFYNVPDNPIYSVRRRQSL
ncbi:hypothetical protein ARMGADRAFT_569142 [Armillaria gallica]|uniref:Uncharacterized protein n=1 Tax=Armillaria gallica TaxID=47427 RepID=A0A2H3ECD3_ARMGA|nr:hypothetical protein ARMGADRAFT_569142 [Armillaria gallica]